MSQYRFVVKRLARRARWGWWARRTRAGMAGMAV
jgi:hypothetical protein